MCSLCSPLNTVRHWHLFWFIFVLIFMIQAGAALVSVEQLRTGSSILGFNALLKCTVDECNPDIHPCGFAHCTCVVLALASIAANACMSVHS